MPSQFRRTWLRSGLLGAVVLTGACGNDGAKGFDRSEADTVVEVTLADFAFKGLPATVKGEKVFFTATNAGPSEHELEVLGPGGKAVDEIEAHAPNSGPRTLAVRLKPGTYTVQCILRTAEGKSHAELGMTAKLQVQ